MDLTARRAHPDPMVLQEHQVQTGHRDHRDLLVHRDCLVLQELMVRTGRQVITVQAEHLDLMDPLGHQEQVELLQVLLQTHHRQQQAETVSTVHRLTIQEKLLMAGLESLWGVQTISFLLGNNLKSKNSHFR